MIRNALTRLAAVLVNFCLTGAAFAAPSYSINFFPNVFLINEALRVDSAGQPYVSAAPYVFAGFIGNDINSSGVIVGTCTFSGSGWMFKGCKRSSDGTVSVIPFNLGSLTPTSSLPFGPTSDAYDINDSGVILGGPTSPANGNINTGLQLFFPNGTLELLPIASNRRPSLNNNLEVVGSGVADEAFYFHDGFLSPLEALVKNIAGFQILAVTDINNEGYIAGIAHDGAGAFSAFVLSPAKIPEPSTSVLALMAGLLFLLSRRHVASRPSRI